MSIFKRKKKIAQPGSQTKLWVDDERPPPDDNWHWARTFKEALLFLATDEIDEISLDNDLGGKEGREGRDVLNHIEEWVHMDPEYQPPKKIEVHSANVAAKQSMEAAIKAIKRARKK